MPYIAQRGGGLLRQIERVGRRNLHPRGQLVAGDPRVEPRLPRMGPLVHAVELGGQARSSGVIVVRLVEFRASRFNTGAPVERKRVP